jgi:hypothetical protein
MKQQKDSAAGMKDIGHHQSTIATVPTQTAIEFGTTEC